MRIFLKDDTLNAGWLCNMLLDWQAQLSEWQVHITRLSGLLAATHSLKCHQSQLLHSELKRKKKTTTTEAACLDKYSNAEKATKIHSSLVQKQHCQMFEFLQEKAMPL